MGIILFYITQKMVHMKSVVLEISRNISSESSGETISPTEMNKTMKTVSSHILRNYINIHKLHKLQKHTAKLSINNEALLRFPAV